MTALQGYARDVGIPQLASDAALRPFEPEEALSIARAELVRPGGPELLSATWEHARWSPRTATSCLYRVQADDGRVLRLALERRVRPRGRFSRAGLDARVVEHLDGLVPAAELGVWTSAWWFPADRALPGARRLLDSSRTRRLLEPAYPALKLRGRRTGLELLRYKPLQRAVLRLDLAVRDPAGARGTIPLAVRALPPRKLARILQARAAVGRLAPRVVAAEVRSGLLVEEWLAGRACGREEFEVARPLGTLLAALHEHTTEQPVPEPDDAALVDLFEVDRRLWLDAHALLAEPLPAGNDARWIHGDVHPDQVLRGADGGVALLDWDALRPGDPAQDLASLWCDALACDARPAAVLDELLAGYADGGARAPTPAALAAHARRELVRRAAAALRRLEVGAAAKAGRLLALAREVAP